MLRKHTLNLPFIKDLQAQNKAIKKQLESGYSGQNYVNVPHNHTQPNIRKLDVSQPANMYQNNNSSDNPIQPKHSSSNTAFRIHSLNPQTTFIYHHGQSRKFI